MEDKELQEMFAARRTVEANRRRQEALRQTLATNAAPKGRRLWPIWTLSAAASIALILITLPVLFRSETEAPLLMAKANNPAAVEPTKTVVPQPQKTLKSLESPESLESLKTLKTLETLETFESPEPATEIAAIEEPDLIVEPEPEETEEPEETIDDGPRIHRRTSTRLANSGNIVNVPSPHFDIQQFLADAFGSETSNPVTLKTIEF